MTYYPNNNGNVLQTFLNPKSKGRQQIDAQQFNQYAMTLSDNALSQFAAQARQQGISEMDINSGIQYIKSLRK